MALWQQYMTLWQNSMLRAWGAPVTPVAEPHKGDKRFRHEDWQDHVLFDYIKQSYLIAARWLHENVASVEGLDEQTQRFDGLRDRPEGLGRLAHLPIGLDREHTVTAIEHQARHDTGARPGVGDDTGRREPAAFRKQLRQDGRISRPCANVVGYAIAEAFGW